MIYAGGVLYHAAFDTDVQKGTGTGIYARSPSDGKLLWSTDVAERANQIIVANGNYFRLGTIGDAYGRMDQYVFQRLRQWWCRKHKVRNRRDARFSRHYLYQKLGVVRLCDLLRRVSRANA